MKRGCPVREVRRPILEDLALPLDLADIYAGFALHLLHYAVPEGERVGELAAHVLVQVDQRGLAGGAWGHAGVGQEGTRLRWLEEALWAERRGRYRSKRLIGLLRLADVVLRWIGRVEGLWS